MRTLLKTSSLPNPTHTEAVMLAILSLAVGLAFCAGVLATLGVGYVREAKAQRRGL